MCAVLFKGDCGWEEEKDPDLCYAMLFVQIENSLNSATLLQI